MLTQRSEGLRRLLLICQIWITAGLFWLGVWVMVKFLFPIRGTDLAPLQHLLCAARAGIDLEYLTRAARRLSAATDLLRELWEPGKIRDGELTRALFLLQQFARFCDRKKFIKSM
jgi:hypothetical protein